MTNLLADAMQSPNYSAVTPDAIAAALDSVIAEHDAVVSRIAAGEGADDFATVWLPLERADVAMSALWSTVSHLHAVADDPALRAAYQAGEERLVALSTRTLQNRALFDRLTTLATSPEMQERPAADRAALDHLLRDFTLSGVALPPTERARFGEISVELSALSTAFGNAVLDATDAWSEHVTDEALLAGVPAPAKAMFAATAQAKNLTGWVVTLQQPSVSAVLTFAENRDLRQRVYTAAGTRASDQGPQAGQFDNHDRMLRILTLRREAASLLGFSDPVARSLATKMAPDAEAIIGFLRDLAARARPGAERDLADLADFAATCLDLPALEPWDIAFVANRLRQQRHSLNEQEIRAFFPVERVVAGWQALLGDLFGIRLVARSGMDLWHGDARYFDVVEGDGTIVAGLYLDLHAREGKRGGAWMAEARPRLRDENRQRVPIAYLTCNFAPVVDGAPSLLSHDDVVTLLHETGHCLHLLFTQVDRPMVAGTNGVEWDAIELPSQLMEDFAWDFATLSRMSGHYETGEPLPEALFDRMVAARHFQAGMFILRQIEFALFDLLLHLAPEDAEPMAVLEAVRDEVAVVRPPAWHRFPHAFSHIFAGGYAAGYYSYLWAEVLAADGFRRFLDAGVRDRATGDALRREVLAMGASRPAAESFRAFRGREVDPQAMLIRHGLAA